MLPSTALPPSKGHRPVPWLISVAEAAQHLGVSSKTVRRWIEQGELPHHRLGRQIRIAESDLIVFLHQCRQA
jgi:excisionase family DNA binding protein